MGQYVCRHCGYRTRKWLGRCPECGEWAALSEQTGNSPRGNGAGHAAPPPIPYPEIPLGDSRRVSTRLPELDRVLGGGLVAGAAILLGGEPGIGKSTLLLQTASAMSEAGGLVLYATGEESAAQLRLRGDRLGIHSSRLLVLAETDVDQVALHARQAPASALVVDSIQAVRCSDLDSVPGSVAQVRECASRLVALAKSSGIPVVMVGHVTKDGAIAGPRILEHAVDTVIQFEGDRHLAHRLLRSVKNRFGPSDELAVFSMSEDGLREVTSPSELFLAERPEGVPGSAVLAAMEGSRPLLVEVQALVGEPAQGSPRRTAVGVDANRLAMLLAVLEKRVGISLAARDVFVNVTGGLCLDEPAADLAVAAASVSSVIRKPIPRRWAVFGEVGLTGEIRAVSRVEARLREAARLGFTGALVPEAAARATVPGGLSLVPARHLEEAMGALFDLQREEE